MKTWAGALLLILALLQLGCRKDESNKPADYSGVQVDIPQLKKAFSSSPDTMRLANDVEFGLRYGDYAKSLEALENLTNNASCTDEQRKLVNATIVQVEKLAGKGSAASGSQ